MEYEVEFKPKAMKDLDSMQEDSARRVFEKIERLGHNL